MNKDELNKIGRLLKGIINGLQSQTLMNKLGLAAIRKIKKRTREGKDVEGRSFQAYSEKYAKKRSRAGLPTHPVNLSWDDIKGMLTRIDHKVFSNFSGVEIDITNPEKRRIASYHNKLGVAKRGKNIRHFFDLSDKDQKDIEQEIDDYTKIIINNLT